MLAVTTATRHPAADRIFAVRAVSSGIDSVAHAETASSKAIAGAFPRLLEAGIDDFGGVSPVTPDHVNPEAPWPERSLLASAAAEQGRVRDIHDVRVRETSGGVFVLFHCRVDAETPVETVHDAVDSVERSVKAAFPEARRVVGHAEPAGAEGAQ